MLINHKLINVLLYWLKIYQLKSKRKQIVLYKFCQSEIITGTFITLSSVLLQNAVQVYMRSSVCNSQHNLLVVIKH